MRIEMKFLKNAWYAAAWTEEVTAKPVGHMILGEPVVFYRTEQGQAVALSDTCPHRFAPLHLGKVTGSVIACPYHGLQFNETGKCVLNPHGPIPAAANIRAYPLAERYGLFWIWMGEKPADIERLPRLPEFEIENLTWVHGTLTVGANYLLVIDNLMDLSHTEFLHPFLGSPGSSARVKYESHMEGDVLCSNYQLDDELTLPVTRTLWPTAPERTSFSAKMHWHAPSNLVLSMNVTDVGGDLNNPALRMPSANILTPETENSTRYFWASGRSTATDNEEVSAMIRAGVEAAFRHEDEPMVAAVQARMAILDTAKMKPVLFKTDAGAVQAQRMLSRLIEAEQVH
jgi:vanillate O-demethylase monooxygenase subunit